jgi:hypothetical protein
MRGVRVRTSRHRKSVCVIQPDRMTARFTDMQTDLDREG